MLAVQIRTMQDSLKVLNSKNALDLWNDLLVKEVSKGC